MSHTAQPEGKALRRAPQRPPRFLPQGGDLPRGGSPSALGHAGRGWPARDVGLPPTLPRLAARPIA